MDFMCSFQWALHFFSCSGSQHILKSPVKPFIHTIPCWMVWGGSGFLDVH